MHNAQAGGGQGGSTTDDGGLTTEDRQLTARARSWNNLDWALYVHFQPKSVGPRIKQYGQNGWTVLWQSSGLAERPWLNTVWWGVDFRPQVHH